MSTDQLFFLSLAGFATAFLTTTIAALMGFFKIPTRRYETEQYASLKSVAWAFLLFIGLKYLLSPALFVVGRYLWSGETVNGEQLALSAEMQGWFTLILMAAMALGYLFYFYVWMPAVRRIAWGKARKPLRELTLGFITWFVAYPWVFATNNLIDGLTWQFYKGPSLEQVAVKHMRQVIEFPTLFWLTALSVIVIVPIIEEILFRGLLQNSLKKWLGAVGSVIITSAAFALIHFSEAQGVFNIGIIASLFVLALFLGYLRERQGSLLAPIGLHATVNAISFFIIIVQEKFSETLVAILPCYCIASFW